MMQIHKTNRRVARPPLRRMLMRAVALSVAAGAALGWSTASQAEYVLDTSFNPVLDGKVWDVVVQPDGKILIAGDFSRVGGQARLGLARLNANGTLDTSFNPPSFRAGGRGPRSLALTKVNNSSNPTHVLVAGGFSLSSHCTSQCNLARVRLSDGALDTSFAANTFSSGSYLSQVVADDNSVWVQGNFSMVGSTLRNKVARFSNAGVLDANFNPPNQMSLVDRIAVHPNGQLLGMGEYNTPSSNPASRGIWRFNNNGGLDTAFQTNTSDGAGATADLQITHNNRILAVGYFSVRPVNTTVKANLARFMPNGAADMSFGDIAPNWSVLTPRNARILGLANGKTVLAGLWHPSRAHIGNDNIDGQLAVFQTSPNEAGRFWLDLQRHDDVWVGGLAEDNNGRILVGGEQLLSGRSYMFALKRGIPGELFSDGFE